MKVGEKMKSEIRILGNERASLSRPAWTSEQKTGMFEVYNHYHCGRKDCPVVVGYYKRSKGVI